MSSINYARNELERIENQCDTPEGLEMQKEVTKDVLELIEVFVNQGHSGFSAGYVAGLFDRLVHWKPLTPLTGEDDEWNDVGVYSTDKSPLYQNKRCSRVFKEADGRVYDIEYWYMKDSNGYAYTNKHCHQDIVFPYMPQKPKLLELTDPDDVESNEKKISTLKKREKELLCKKAKGE